MRTRTFVAMASVLMPLGVGATCRSDCRDRVATCVAASPRGPERAADVCRREVWADCRRNGSLVCPPLDVPAFATELAAVGATLAGLCPQMLPDVPAASGAEAVAVGRTAAGVALGVVPEALRLKRYCGRSTFCASSLAKVLGGGIDTDLLPFFRVVAFATAARTVGYVAPDGRQVAAIVGVRDGRSFGIMVVPVDGGCANTP